MEMLREKAMSAFHGENYYLANTLFTRLIEMNTSEYTDYTNRSAINFMLSNCEQALKDAEMAIKFSPNRATGYIRRANALNK